MVINNVGTTTTTTTTDQDPASEHSRPSVRICKVDKSESGSCGFHLTRTKWDPYPWIAGVDDGSPAQAAGLRVGDCVLEVNGDDVLGQRVGQIAAKVVAAHECIAMLLWNAGSDANCDTEVSAIAVLSAPSSRLSVRAVVSLVAKCESVVYECISSPISTAISTGLHSVDDLFFPIFSGWLLTEKRLRVSCGHWCHSRR